MYLLDFHLRGTSYPPSTWTLLTEPCPIFEKVVPPKQMEYSPEWALYHPPPPHKIFFYGKGGRWGGGNLICIKGPWKPSNTKESHA